MQFQIVVCGLDSIEARRWINATLVNMVDMENQDSLKPLIDGGTEGGHDVTPYSDTLASLTALRFQGPNSRHLPNFDTMYRVPAGPIYSEGGGPSLYISHNPSTARALYRVGSYHRVGSRKAISRIRQRRSGAHYMAVSKGVGTSPGVWYHRRHLLAYPRRRKEYYPGHRIHQRHHRRQLLQ